MLINIRANRGQHIAGFGLARAIGGAIVALIAQPDIGVFHQIIDSTPPGHDHLFTGKWPVIGRKVANHRAGGALIALLEAISSQSFHFPDKIQIRLNYMSGHRLSLFLVYDFGTLINNIIKSLNVFAKSISQSSKCQDFLL